MPLGSAAQEGVGDAGRARVDRVVEGVYGGFLYPVLPRRRGDPQRGQHHQPAAFVLRLLNLRMCPTPPEPLCAFLNAFGGQAGLLVP